MGGNYKEEKKVPEYTRKSIHAYQQRNYRLALWITYDLFELFKEKYGEKASFNGYIKELMNKALEQDMYGKCPRIENRDTRALLKHCLFSKDYKEKLTAKYESYAKTAGHAFEFSLYVQWLVCNDLGVDINYQK